MASDPPDDPLTNRGLPGDPSTDDRLEDALAFAQDLLSPDERAAFLAHREGCAACQATSERVAAFLPAVQRALTPELPSHAAVLAAAKAAVGPSSSAAVAAPAGKPWMQQIWWRFALGLGVTAAVVAVLMLVFAAPPRPAPKRHVFSAPKRTIPDAAKDAGAPR